MGRRLPDTADIRKSLSKFLRVVDEADMPGHSTALLLHISAQSDGTVGYADASLKVKLNEGQMERAVTSLRTSGLIVVSSDSADARRKRLTITKDGESVVGDIIKASSSD